MNQLLVCGLQYLARRCTGRVFHDMGEHTSHHQMSAAIVRFFLHEWELVPFYFLGP